MSLILDCLYLAAGLAYGPVILYRTALHGRYRKGWPDRLGLVRPRDSRGPCIWIHAVSLGEVNACRTIVAGLRQARPDCQVVLSSTTDTGWARAKTLFGQDHEVFYMPFDLSWSVRRAFERVRPSLCLLMELEVWPHFVAEACRRSVPVVVANGRISDRSFKRYRLVRPFLAATFARLQLILAQTSQYAQRFLEMGCSPERMVVAGMLKFDTADLADTVEGADKLASYIGLGQHRLWVAGGTGTGEEALILQAHQILRQDPRLQDVTLAIVPRKPERFDAVAQQILKAGFHLVRYSQVRGGRPSAPLSGQTVILGDTLGDLRKFYSIATVAFVGRSLVPMGGSDMIEAAALGRPTIFGPHVENFSHPAQVLLEAGGAVQVHCAAQLAQAVRGFMLDPESARRTAENARYAIRMHQGATKATLDRILPLLPDPS